MTGPVTGPATSPVTATPSPSASAGDLPGRAPELRASGLARPASEAGIATLPGNDEQLDQLVLVATDFGAVTDEPTRPGQYARAESDFSDLAADPRSPATGPRPAPRALVERPLGSSALDDPPTARHDVAPEVHARGGLMPFVQRDAFAPEPTMTSPLIEIIDESVVPEVPESRDEPPRTTPPYQREMETSQMPPALVLDLRRASVDEDPLVALQVEAHTRGAIAAAQEAPHGDQEKQSGANPGATLFGIGPRSDRAAARPAMPASGTMQGVPPLQRPPSGPDLAFASPSGRAHRPRWPLVVGALVVLAAGGAIAAWRMQASNLPPHATAVSKAAPADAAAESNPHSAGSSAELNAGLNPGPNAGSGAGHNSDSGAGHNAGSGAGSDARPVVTPTASSDGLAITSTPAGARVYIDGADQGVTPVKLAGSAARHTMALLLPGHELYVAEVDGHGRFDLPLKPVTPPGGGAGIKVIKCKDKARYYIFLDGKPTGMTCPSERIATTVGAHTVEVYDVVTQTRRKWEVNVADERLSFRVRVE